MEQEENQQEIKFCIKCWKREILDHANPDIGLYDSILTKLDSIMRKSIKKCLKEYFTLYITVHYGNKPKV